MSLSSTIFAEIRSQSRKKSIRLVDLIDDLDPKNTGKLSTIRFRRLFNLLSIWMEPEKFDQLAAEYRIEDTDFIDTARFLDDYEHPQEVQKQLVSDEQLREFGKQVIIQNTTIPECLFQFDRFHAGHVSIDSFLAAFGTSPFTKLLAQQYSRPPTNDVYYFDLTKDVERVLKEKPLRETTFQQTMSKLPPYFKDVANAIRLNQVDPYQVLSAHDKFKKMTILPAHFKADVSNLGLSLTENQMNEIANLFTVNNRFDYVSFCEAVDQEKDNIIKENETQLIAEKEIENKVEPKDINDVINYIQTTIQERHSLICDRLAHFDPLNTGKLSEIQFFKIFEAEKFDLLDPDRLAIINEFSDGEGNIDYKAFSIAVTPPQPNPLSELELIIERLKSYLEEKQIQILPYCERLDTERTGTILFNQLLSIFRNILFDINPKERKILKMSTTQNVNIEEFCSKVDPPFIRYITESEEEKSKSLKNEEEEEKEIEIPDKQTMDALARVASVVDHENIELVNEFRRYENSPLVRPSTFRATLIQIPVRISDEDIELLLNKYKDQPSKLVDSVAFMRDIQTYGKDQLKIEPDLSLTTTADFLEPNENVKSILRRLKVVLLNKNLSGPALFKPYDQSSFGFVSVDRLHSILSYIGFVNQITPDELKQLESAFQPNKKPDLFNYRRMLLLLEKQEVNKDDYAKVPVYHSGTFSGEYALINLTNTIHSKLQARHKNARYVFFDAPDGPIPYGDFRQRIMNYGLVISQADLQLLMRSYRANMNGDIDWKRFCDDVDTIKTVQPPL
ncbi:hypothetical protein M9Y10_029410 [Tritrichomonas musculus]|uniref:EF hand family protein n=1 Tax=Tritrichomonas musculus TaxID=1915356 RepID=A0ABR2KP35_9EUKA